MYYKNDNLFDNDRIKIICLNESWLFHILFH